MILFNNQFITISYLEYDRIMRVQWSTESEHLEDEHFREINEMYLSFVEQYLVEGFLLDTNNFLYVIDIETQTWVSEQILPKLKEKGVKKVAFIVSKELITQLSIEQTMDENPSLLITSYFDSEVEAVAWLTKRQKVATV